MPINCNQSTADMISVSTGGGTEYELLSPGVIRPWYELKDCSIDGVQFTLWGIPIEVGGQVEAIAISGNIGIGIKDGEFYFGAGAAVLFGGSFYIRIKLW